MWLIDVGLSTIVFYVPEVSYCLSVISADRILKLACANEYWLVCGVDAAQVLSNGRPEEDLDLLYDPTLDCYYDPKTNRYYELK